MAIALSSHLLLPFQLAASLFNRRLDGVVLLNESTHLTNLDGVVGNRFKRLPLVAESGIHSSRPIGDSEYPFARAELATVSVPLLVFVQQQRSVHQPPAVGIPFTVDPVLTGSVCYGELIKTGHAIRVSILCHLSSFPSGKKSSATSGIPRTRYPPSGRNLSRPHPTRLWTHAINLSSLKLRSEMQPFGKAYRTFLAEAKLRFREAQAQLKRCGKCAHDYP